MSKWQDRQISPQSAVCANVKPGKKLLSSATAGWKSVLVETIESPSHADAYDTSSTPDHLLVLLVKGQALVERYSGRVWKKAIFRPGVASMTASSNSSRLRWSSLLTPTIESTRIYIPQSFFQEAQEEYRRAGASVRQDVTDAFSYSDPIVFQIVTSLAQAIPLGAPELYAESATQFLATHLLSQQSPWQQLTEDPRGAEDLTDGRLTRVLDYMQENFGQSLTLAELAEEAGSSRFHFIKLFRQKLGITPHRYLTEIRMTAACTMLTTTDLPVAQIASACGTQSAAQFAAAFKRHFSHTPSAFRAAYEARLERPSRNRRRR